MRTLLVLILSLSLTACSHLSAGTAGYAAGGAALGAGTGVAVRAIRGAGDMASYVIGGAATGLASGLAVGVGKENSDKQDEIEKVSMQIDTNEEIIKDQERELEALQQRLSEDAQKGDPNKEYEERIYDGPTLGVYYR